MLKSVSKSIPLWKPSQPHKKHSDDQVSVDLFLKIISYCYRFQVIKQQKLEKILNSALTEEGALHEQQPLYIDDARSSVAGAKIILWECGVRTHQSTCAQIKYTPKEKKRFSKSRWRSM